MNTLIRNLALAGLLALGAGAASAGVTVKYIEPERFSDLPFAPWEREEVLRDLSEHFTELGKSLPPGQDLLLEVTDIDLAGREYPNVRSTRDLRVLQGMADWPIVTLRYTLTGNGQVLKSGEARIMDMNYLQRGHRLWSNERLSYEKRMIDEWFAETIVPKRRG